MLPNARPAHPWPRTSHESKSSRELLGHRSCVTPVCVRVRASPSSRSRCEPDRFTTPPAPQPADLTERKAVLRYLSICDRNARIEPPRAAPACLLAGSHLAIGSQVDTPSVSASTWINSIQFNSSRSPPAEGKRTRTGMHVWHGRCAVN